MLRLALLPLICVCIAPAQEGVPVVFPSALQEYLNLSSDQREAIVRLNIDYSTLEDGQKVRIQQQEAEIRELTAQPKLDAQAIGARYVEIETIRRQLRDSLAATRKKALAVLSAAQQAKLKTLPKTAELQPVVEDAICVRLLEGPEPARTTFGAGGNMPKVMSVGNCTFPHNRVIPLPPRTRVRLAAFATS
jgi:hypothetical protein